MALAGQAAVRRVDINLGTRRVTVIHEGGSGAVENVLTSLQLGSHLVEQSDASNRDIAIHPSPHDEARTLAAVLAINAAMFVVEAAAGLAAGSVSLQADALDFFGDAANYGLSLSVLTMALVWRARAALVKGVSMGLFGVWVIAAAAVNVTTGETPHAATMGVVGFAALLANVGVAADGVETPLAHGKRLGLGLLVVHGVDRAVDDDEFGPEVVRQDIGGTARDGGIAQGGQGAGLQEGATRRQ